MKKTVITLLLIIPLFLLTACWDRKEINDMAIVTAAGVDKSSKQKYRFSVQVPLPSSLGGPGSSGGGGGTTGGGPFFLAQGSGGNLQQGINDIQTRLSRKLYFSHRRVLIIGENLARNGIKSTLNSTFIEPQSRLSTFLIVSKGDAMKLLETQPRMEQSSGEALREMANTNINKTILDALQDLERPGKALIIPLAEQADFMKKKKNGKEVEMNKFALFKEDKLSFITSKRESIGVLWLLERMKNKNITFSVLRPDDTTVQIIENQIKTKLCFEDDKPVFHLSLRATGSLLENAPGLALEDPQTYALVVEKMETEIRKDINSIISHAHSQAIDVYGFGWYLFRNQYQEWTRDWEKDWDNILPSLKVNIKIEADIQRAANTGYVRQE